MGSNKAIVEIDGAPWWRTQMDRFGDMGIRSLWALSPEAAEQIRRADDAPTQMVICSPDKPMFHSFARAIALLSEDPPETVFVLPVDCPAPSRAVWESLLGVAPVAAPSFEGEIGHPLALSWHWVDANVCPHLRESSPDLRLDALTRADRRIVPVSDPNVRMNLNHRADVIAWLDGLS
jgi:CTP:molybdopterin cytidylyltransferase MocA